VNANRLTTRITGRRAFSLAELMVALIILGLGLLFIAAALPVGLEYTRQTVDLGASEAGGEYALEQVQAGLRTSSKMQHPDVPDYPGLPRRLDGIFQPRLSAAPYETVDRYEPFFKVRPLVMGNVRFEAPEGSNNTREIVDDAERVIGKYLSALSITAPSLAHEVDIWLLTNHTGLGLAENPLVPGVARVYPPIEPVRSYLADDFLDGTNGDDDYTRYGLRIDILDGDDDELPDREWAKTLDTRIAWTAFYRRVAWDEPGPGTPPSFEAANSPPVDDILTDPLKYELIVVVTRRPTVRHRFPRQNIDNNNNLTDFEKPLAYVPGDSVGDDYDSTTGFGAGRDRVAPMPWLVTFRINSGNSLPTLDASNYDTSDAWSDRMILNYSDPPTLEFTCEPELGRLLPPGSIFIPAVNDNYRQNGAGLLYTRATGFVPHSPHACPIYKVVEAIEGEQTDDPWTIVVENNGLYPWIAGGNDESQWPVWIIPPSFIERDSDEQPIYEPTSPIIGVYRRLITLREAG